MHATPPLTLWQRTGNMVGLARAFARVPFWFAIPRQAALARWIEQRFFNRLLHSVGIRLSVSGEVCRQPGTLYVCNHISWADIPVLGVTLDAAFVAKAEAGAWPVIGHLMHRYGVVLVNRTQRATSGLQVEAITQRLAAGQSVILFPEGTTSDGEGLLPFRTSLMQAARVARAVQPIILRYLTPNGARLPKKAMPI